MAGQREAVNVGRKERPSGFRPSSMPRKGFSGEAPPRTPRSRTARQGSPVRSPLTPRRGAAGKESPQPGRPSPRRRTRSAGAASRTPAPRPTTPRQAAHTQPRGVKSPRRESVLVAGHLRSTPSDARTAVRRDEGGLGPRHPAWLHTELPEGAGDGVHSMCVEEVSPVGVHVWLGKGDGTLWHVELALAAAGRPPSVLYQPPGASRAVLACLERIEAPGGGTRQLWGGYADGTLRTFTPFLPADAPGATEHPTALLADLKAHPGGVTAIAGCGDSVLTAGQDRRVVQWAPGAERPVQLMQITGHGSPVRCLAALPTQGLWLSGSDNAVRCWSVTGHCLDVLKGHSAQVLSVCVLSTDGSLWSGDADGVVLVWDEQLVLQARLEGHGGPVTGIVQVQQDGRVWTADKHGVVLVWDPVARRVLQKITPEAKRGRPGGVQAIRAMGFVRRVTMDLMLTCSRDGGARVWASPAPDADDQAAVLRAELETLKRKMTGDSASLHDKHRKHAKAVAEQHEAEVAALERQLACFTGGSTQTPLDYHAVLAQKDSQIAILKGELEAARCLQHASPGTGSAELLRLNQTILEKDLQINALTDQLAGVAPIAVRSPDRAASPRAVGEVPPLQLPIAEAAAHIAVLEAELARCRERDAAFVTLTEQVQRLCDQLGEKDDRIGVIAAQLGEKDACIAALLANAAASPGRVPATDPRAAAMAHDVERLCVQALEKDARIEQMAAALAGKEQAAERAAETAAALAREAQESGRRVAELEAGLAAKDALLDGLRGEADALRRQVDELVRCAAAHSPSLPPEPLPYPPVSAVVSDTHTAEEISLAAAAAPPPFSPLSPRGAAQATRFPILPCQTSPPPALDAVSTSEVLEEQLRAANAEAAAWRAIAWARGDVSPPPAAPEASLPLLDAPPPPPPAESQFVSPNGKRGPFAVLAPTGDFVGAAAPLPPPVPLPLPAPVAVPVVGEEVERLQVTVVEQEALIAALRVEVATSAEVAARAEDGERLRRALAAAQEDVAALQARNAELVAAAAPHAGTAAAAEEEGVAHVEAPPEAAPSPADEPVPKPEPAADAGDDAEAASLLAALHQQLADIKASRAAGGGATPRAGGRRENEWTSPHRPMALGENIEQLKHELRVIQWAHTAEVTQLRAEKDAEKRGEAHDELVGLLEEQRDCVGEALALQEGVLSATVQQEGVLSAAVQQEGVLSATVRGQAEELETLRCTIAAKDAEIAALKAERGTAAQRTPSRFDLQLQRSRSRSPSPGRASQASPNAASVRANRQRMLLHDTAGEVAHLEDLVARLTAERDAARADVPRRVAELEMAAQVLRQRNADLQTRQRPSAEHQALRERAEALERDRAATAAALGGTIAELDTAVASLGAAVNPQQRLAQLGGDGLPLVARVQGLAQEAARRRDDDCGAAGLHPRLKLSLVRLEADDGAEALPAQKDQTAFASDLLQLLTVVDREHLTRRRAYETLRAAVPAADLRADDADAPPPQRGALLPTKSHRDWEALVADVTARLHALEADAAAAQVAVGHLAASFPAGSTGGAPPSNSLAESVRRCAAVHRDHDRTVAQGLAGAWRAAASLAEGVAAAAHAFAPAVTGTFADALGSGGGDVGALADALQRLGGKVLAMRRECEGEVAAVAGLLSQHPFAQAALPASAAPGRKTLQHIREAFHALVDSVACQHAEQATACTAATEQIAAAAAGYETRFYPSAAAHGRFPEGVAGLLDAVRQFLSVVSMERGTERSLVQRILEAAAPAPHTIPRCASPMRAVQHGLTSTSPRELSPEFTMVDDGDCGAAPAAVGGFITVRELRRASAQVEASLSRWHAADVAAHSRLAAAQTTLAEALHAKSTVEAQYAQSVGDLENMSHALATATAQAGRHEVELATYRKMQGRLEAELAEMATAQQAAEREAAAARGELAQRTEAAAAEGAAARAAAAAKQGEVDRLSVALKQAQLESDAATKGLWEELRQTSSGSQQALAALRAQFEEEVAALQQRLAEKAEEAAAARRVLIDKDTTLVMQKGQIAALTAAARRAPLEQ